MIIFSRFLYNTTVIVLSVVVVVVEASCRVKLLSTTGSVLTFLYIRYLQSFSFLSLSLKGEIISRFQLFVDKRTLYCKSVQYMFTTPSLPPHHHPSPNFHRHYCCFGLFAAPGQDLRVNRQPAPILPLPFDHAAGSSLSRPV